jgi:hypothetical protein
MSWSIYGSTVCLEMSLEDYNALMIVIGYGLGSAPHKDPEFFQSFARLLNRLNEGNPNYTPYGEK